MIVYRLCRKAYVNDLSGYGAEINAGRWNNKGYAALYTSGSRALAVLEVAVHIPLGIIPVDYYMITIKIANSVTIAKINIVDLPHTWNRNPIIKTTQHLGDDFLKSGSHLVLQVPSATVPGDWNYIINPRHPDFKKINIETTEPFEFDSRLFKN